MQITKIRNHEEWRNCQSVYDGQVWRPHGLRHLAITEAYKAAQANGMDLEEVLDFSRHKDVKTLMIYRDRDRNVQGQLAALVANV